MSKGTTRRFSTRDSMIFLTRFDATIVVLTEPGAGTEYPLQSHRLVVGRGPDVDVVFEDDHLSRQHAAFELTSDGFQVRDLGSTNGIRVNDKPVEIAALQHGDRVQMGQLTLQYVVQDRASHIEFEVSDD